MKLSFDFKDNQILISCHLNCYFIIAFFFCFACYFLFLLKRHKFSTHIFVLLISIVIFIAACILTPKREGDGHEYFLMLESLFNHLSPELQTGDVESLKNLKNRFLIDHFSDHFLEKNPGYFKGNDGKYYSYHFWLYPFCSLPMKYILHVFHFNEFKAFQITNAILLAIALLSIIFLLKTTEAKKMLFTLMIIFCPAFWFISWPHPEIFSFSFVLMSLVFFNIRKIPASIIFASVASTQNPPLIFLAVFLAINGILNSKNKKENFSKFFLSMSPVFLPYTFYYSKFGTFSIIAKQSASLRNLSLFRVWEMFFDLNIGILPYLPLTLFIFLGTVIWDILKTKKITLNVEFFILMMLMMLACTPTTNWNSGTSGPIRYVIWMLPLIFYSIVIQVEWKHFRKTRKLIYLSLLLLAIIIQGMIVIIGGGFSRPAICYIYHTSLAEFVLDNFPTLYNPSVEIFIERTLHREGPADTPVIYYSKNSKCKKVLAKRKDKEQIIQLCGYIPKKYEKFFRNGKNEDEMIYINY